MPVLARYVDQLWLAAAGGEGRSGDGAVRIERVLPTGAMHLVVRLDAPLTLVSAAGAENVGHAILGGARASFYERDVTRSSRGVGALLRPGAAEALFGVPASELAHRHTPLDALLGASVIASLRDELASSPTPLRVFERFLAQRLRPVAVAPPVREMLRMLATGSTVAAAVERAGYSHRACVAMFSAAVGLGPKAYARVRRFQRALVATAPLATVASTNGYADQAHLCRDFAELAGISPTAHRKLALASPNHVPR